MKPVADLSYIDHISQFTDKLVNLYNRDYKAGDHGTPEDQFRRYLALCGIADLNYASILDAGCGVGLIYDYLVDALDSFRRGLSVWRWNMSLRLIFVVQIFLKLL